LTPAPEAADATAPGGPRETYRVLIVGPAGRERASVEAMLSGDGHHITGASFEEAAALAGAADYDLALVVDRRSPGPRTWTPAGLPTAARLPVLLLAGQPTRLLAALSPSEAELKRSGRPGMGAWLTPLPSLSDEALAQLVRAGSVPAFEMLHERYAPSLLRYCRSVLRRPQEAEEALQSTMLSAFQALRQGRLLGTDARVRPWLFRIAHNQCVDTLRRRRGRDAEGLDWREPADDGGPERVVANRAELRTVLDDLGALDQEQRSALVLRELGGLSHVEIASSLGTTPTRAKSLIAQARDSLTAFEAGRDLACADLRRRLARPDGRVMRSREVRAHLRACSDCQGYADERAAAPRPQPAAEPLAVA
jgi:RNA polymerase sigma factor (sigma-70 family)